MGILAPDVPPPEVQEGDGIKLFQDPDFGREDATVTRVHRLGVINCRTVKADKQHLNVDHINLTSADPELEAEQYWVELPPGYVPGSEGY